MPEEPWFSGHDPNVQLRFFRIKRRRSAGNSRDILSLRLFLFPVFLTPLFFYLLSTSRRYPWITHERGGGRWDLATVPWSQHASPRGSGKKKKRERNGRREAKSHSRTRSCVDSCMCTYYVFINVLVPFHGTSSDAFDVDARRSMTRIGTRFHELISWDYLRWSTFNMSVFSERTNGQT